LAQAWFNATRDQVLGMTMESAVEAAEGAARVGGKAAETLIDQVPNVLDSGARLLDAVIPK
jgi:hypothetical protein